MSATDDVAIDREAEPIQRPACPEGPDADAMLGELQSVLASPDFARTPIMKRLLTFLVGETAAGRGDQLKAYSVAVDGLGRAPDYDARADSYPRVQVGRLRRMLDSHYTATAPAGGRRLTIPNGRYRVALQPLHTEDPVATRGDLPAPPRVRPVVFATQVVALLVLLAVASMALIRLLPVHIANPAAVSERPMMELASGRLGAQSELAPLLEAVLLNGLGRSSTFDLRLAAPAGAAVSSPAPRYRLSTDIVEGPRPRLFLHLAHLSPDRLIWSGDVSLPDREHRDSASLDAALAPAIATISRVNGVVAAHELQESGGQKAVGYSCMLLYHRYRKDRTLAEEEHVRSCIEHSLQADPGDAALQAAAAMQAVERSISSRTDLRERPALLLTARRHAYIASSVDPQDAWALAARSRIAVVRDACPQAIGFGLKATQLQPYDPAMLADIALNLLGCGDARAEAMIRRAIALDDDPAGRFYVPLLLLAIGRDDPVLAREALARMVPPPIGRQGRFYLVSAAGYAMLGDMAKARSAWRQLVVNSPEIVADPKAHLDRMGLTAGLRARVIAHLSGARLISS